MAAKWVSKVVGAAAKPFEDMGIKIGQLWASLPKYIPLPIPGWSMAGMERGVDIAKQIPQKRAEERFENSDFWRSLWAWKMASGGDMKYVKERLDKIKDGDRAIVTRWSTESRDAIQKLVSNWDKYDKTGVYKQFMDAVKDAHKSELAIENYLKDGWMESNMAAKLAKEIYAGRTDRTWGGIEADKIWKELGKTWVTSATPAANTTNNSFNIVTDINTGKYTLTWANLKSDTPMTKDEMITALKKNIHLLVPLTNEAITAELKEMNLQPNELKKFLEDVDKKREEVKKKS